MTPAVAGCLFWLWSGCAHFANRLRRKDHSKPDTTVLGGSCIS